MSEQLKKERNISDDIINLVVARLETIPPNVEISVGSGGDYTVEGLIDSVKKQNEIGKQVIDMQLSYIRSFATQSKTQ